VTTDQFAGSGDLVKRHEHEISKKLTPPTKAGRNIYSQWGTFEGISVDRLF
jgi:hypothetical protein